MPKARRPGRPWRPSPAKPNQHPGRQMLRFFKRNRQENIEHTQDAVKPSRERWFGRIFSVLRSSNLDEAVWEELEEILISSDVGVDTSLRIIEELKATVKDKGLESGDQVFESLKESLVAGIESENAESLWMDETEVTGPYVILMVGVNGVGKTTSIAKLAHHFTQEGKKVILGAADTFRAAAAEQLEILG
ncbi:MAG TPA: signal recognition particle-docking protein FtsY, partial [Dehalococcoidia bacterium]|nr:signal recognition particle-docking protein FtsY [Dehalococcoidia bacterium]